MGFRSRALLTGVATGFLKANNDRRDAMQKRLLELSDANATMARERARSQADNASKAAAAEASEWHALRSAGHIDDEGNYTDAYYNAAGYAEFKKEDVRKSFGNDYNSFVQEFKKMQPKKFIRQYKDPTEIEGELARIYDSINVKQQRESSAPVLTGFDSMFGSMVNRVTSAVGAGEILSTGSPTTQHTEGTPAITGLRDNVESVPSGTYEAPNFKPVAPESQKANQFITDSSGRVHAVFADSVTGITSFDTNIVKDSESSSGFGKMGTEKVRIFNARENKYYDEATHRDIATGLVRVGAEWVALPEEHTAVPSDVKPEFITYTDPDTQEEMKVQAYQTSGAAYGDNIITQPDGTTWATMGLPVKLHGKQDQHETASNTIPEAVKKNLEEFGRQRQTIKLTDALLKQDYVSNPVDATKRMLSTATDVLGASFGFNGTDRQGDLEAIIKYANAEITAAKLEDKVGWFDAAAVKAGNKDAIQNFLTYSLARSQYGGDRLSVSAVEEAKAVVQPWMSGTETHRGALAGVRSQAESALSSVVSSDLALALGSPTSKVWEFYPEAHRKYTQGLTPVHEVFEGKRLVERIKNLEKVDPAAYKMTITNVVKQLGPSWESKLVNPIRVDAGTNVVFLPFYRENKDGSFNVGIFKAK